MKRAQENDQCLLKKYKNIRFFDNEYNQGYIIALENLEFKGPIRRNKKYCVVGQSLYYRDGDNVNLLILRDINDDFMVLIRGVKQGPDLVANVFHPSIDDDSEAKDSDKEENNNENNPKTPYDGENMKASSDDEENND